MLISGRSSRLSTLWRPERRSSVKRSITSSTRILPASWRIRRVSLRSSRKLSNSRSHCSHSRGRTRVSGISWRTLSTGCISSSERWNNSWSNMSSKSHLIKYYLKTSITCREINIEVGMKKRLPEVVLEARLEEIKHDIF